MNSKLTGEGDDVKKNLIDIFNFKQRLLSIDMKTKIVQHVPSFQVFKFSKFSGSQCLSDFQTFFISSQRESISSFDKEKNCFGSTFASLIRDQAEENLLYFTSCFFCYFVYIHIRCFSLEALEAQNQWRNYVEALF